MLIINKSFNNRFMMDHPKHSLSFWKQRRITQFLLPSYPPPKKFYLRSILTHHIPVRDSKPFIRYKHDNNRIIHTYQLNLVILFWIYIKHYYPGITVRPFECSVNIFVNSSGYVLTSPNFPSSYPNDRCNWFFTSEPDSTIQITFTDFSTHPYDFVSVSRVL